jgi:trigger factor
MSQAATQERPNAVTISDAGPSRKRLSIEIPAETVSEKLKESLDTLAVEAQIPGFRKGRAPRGLIERKFGATLRADATRSLVAQAYSRAVEDHKLKVIAEPSADQLDKLEAQPGRPLRFDLEVEVMPEFDLPPLTGIEVRKPIIEVTEDMVAEELRKLCINEGKLEQQDTPEPGDYLTGRGVMTGEDGTEFYNIPGAVVQVPPADRAGKGMILGITVEDFDRQLGRPRAGQAATIRAVGPENHEIEGVRNAKLTMSFTVERIDRIIPAVPAEIASRFGFEDEDQLRDTIRTRLAQRAMIEQQSAMRQQLAAHLMGRTTVVLPERLTAQQTARTLERQRLELMYRGVEPQKIEEHVSELRAASGAQAAAELKLFFILNKAAEQLDVQVSEAEINGRIAQIAAERNVRPEQLRQEMVNRNQVGTVYQQVREHKTFDAILATAKITEVPLDEFRKAEGDKETPAARKPPRKTKDSKK